MVAISSNMVCTWGLIISFAFNTALILVSGNYCQKYESLYHPDNTIFSALKSIRMPRWFTEYWKRQGNRTSLVQLKLKAVPCATYRNGTTVQNASRVKQQTQ